MVHQLSYSQLLIVSLLLLSLNVTIFHAKSLPIFDAKSLPIFDPGVFVISGVSSCGSGSGYCLLGVDCTLNEDFLPDDSDGHCDGLKNAFTPAAYFVCCRYKNKSEQPADGRVMTVPTVWPSISTTERANTEFMIGKTQHSMTTWIEPIDVEQPAQTFLLQSPNDLSTTNGELIGLTDISHALKTTTELNERIADEGTSGPQSVGDAAKTDEILVTSGTDNKNIGESRWKNAAYDEGTTAIIDGASRSTTSLMDSVSGETDKADDDEDDELLEKTVDEIISGEKLISSTAGVQTSGLQSEDSIVEFTTVSATVVSNDDDTEISQPAEVVPSSEEVAGETSRFNGEVTESQSEEKNGTSPDEQYQFTVSLKMVQGNSADNANVGQTVVEQITTSSSRPELSTVNVQIGKKKSSPFQKFLLASQPANLYNRLQTSNDKDQSKDFVHDKDSYTRTRDIPEEVFFNSRNVLSKEECYDVVAEDPKANFEASCPNRWRFYVEHEFLCYGVLVNPLWLVTSASCIMRIFEKGMDKVTVLSEINDGDQYSISNMIVNENYKSIDEETKLEANNIGLVSLSNYADVSCLPCLPKPSRRLSEKVCQFYSSEIASTVSSTGNTTRNDNVVCEGRVKSLNTFSDSYLTLPCKSETVAKVLKSDVGNSLWCGNILAGVTTPSNSGMLIYTPVAEFIDWISKNINLYSK